MQDELDGNLQLLFREKSRGLPEEPFLGDVLKVIQKRQARRIFRHRVVLVLGLACCFFLSPVLIKGSILISRALNTGLVAAEGFLDTRTGMLSAALCALLMLFFKRRQISGWV